MKKCLLRYCQQSVIITIVKIKEKPFNIFVTIVYAPTQQSKKMEFEYFLFYVRHRQNSMQITRI